LILNKWAEAARAVADYEKPATSPPRAGGARSFRGILNLSPPSAAFPDEDSAKSLSFTGTPPNLFANQPISLARRAFT
jgi:hypothetical protein